MKKQFTVTTGRTLLLATYKKGKKTKAYTKSDFIVQSYTNEAYYIDEVIELPEGTVLTAIKEDERNITFLYNDHKFSCCKVNNAFIGFDVYDTPLETEIKLWK